MSKRKAAKRAIGNTRTPASGPASGTVHRRRVLGSALVAAMAGLLGRWRKRAEAAPMPARRRGERPPGSRPPIKWIGHM